MGALSDLSNIEVEVTDPDGQSVPALLKKCPCGGREWFLYLILVGGVAHPHVQCVECDQSYCDGTCCGGEAAAATMEATS